MAKENAYKKRELESISAPLNCSSDSEFAAGPIKVTEREPGKKKRNAKSQRDSGRPTKKRKFGWSDSEDEKCMDSLEISANTTSRSQTYGKNANGNPLAKYFVEIDDESNDDADDEMQVGNDDDEENEDEDQDYGEEKVVHIPKTMVAVLPVARQVQKSPRCHTSDAEQSSHTEDDSSHTESDSEPPFPPIIPIVNADSSHTEDDPEFG
ncbi:hypothetical protein DFJ43DRAFT_1156448 [Lentinula guzmanii]|uniref:Uncharacterized protein n=1 Tax=Lentinula guzmanii TaxID=2804957 RepID=A0AA38J8Z2_9AGAR|nr:hypothetical protein DFJ43DRAFT_1156448 [Lentinula guzmanii]